jgi:hypothetical protein
MHFVIQISRREVTLRLMYSSLFLPDAQFQLHYYFLSVLVVSIVWTCRKVTDISDERTVYVFSSASPHGVTAWKPKASEVRSESHLIVIICSLH